VDIESIMSRLAIEYKQIAARDAGVLLPDAPGLYMISIDHHSSLPDPFGSYLEEQGNSFIYLGKATVSLRERLYEQDLRHRSPSTFFRGIGAILGYRPPKGSLAGKANENNYSFSGPDTEAIVAWIDEHLSVYCLTLDPDTASELEPHAIAALRPLLNTQHNPAPLPELARLRDECRQIARGSA
jgi:hypothetical protein